MSLTCSLVPQEYYGEQPWSAVPFEDRAAEQRLSKKFKVTGLPCLVIVDGDGELITKEGQDAVLADPRGENYPWRPPGPAEILAALGQKITKKAKGKHLGLYFSAHWCPPCRQFTPRLAKWYNEGLKDKLEIVYCSDDQDQGQFDEYSAEMPWLKLKFSKREEKELITKALGVTGLPMLVVLNPDGSVLTMEGQAGVVEDPTGASLPDGWLPKPFTSVEDGTEGLNDEQALVAFGDSRCLHKAVKKAAQDAFAAAGKAIEAMPLR
jgi:nucleoredoxin